MIELAPNDVHVWWGFPDEVNDPLILERCATVLSPAEAEQRQRFVFERDRHSYLVSHALVRDVLSRYAPVQPQDWRFSANAYGCPAIDSPEEWRNLRFNLSHTRGRAVVAIARSVDVGIDVEATRAETDLTGIAHEFFSPREVAQLSQMPGAFFDFWTLKEAYIKARGMGLAIPLDSFSFVLDDAKSPSIVFEDGSEDTPDRWQFFLERGDCYCMAIAAATSPGIGLHVVQRNW